MNILLIIASYIPPFLSDFSSLLTGLGPRACWTVWRRSEREKQISYMNAYLWNLEEWY